MSFKEVNTQVSFPKEEEKILDFWVKNNIFEKSIKERSEEKLYSFYDGPPFATGLPHYGHLVAGILKDIIPRYWTMKGFRVERRFGWDCHGLPVEYEIDKAFNIHGRKGVEQFGIANYNKECRGIVQRYTTEWEHTVNRVGRWVDFKNDYKTLDPEFMESVWWVFKQLWDKGLVYEGHKVLPYSTEVATPLSNFEASSNYRELQDPSITIRFAIKGEENTSFLAWTTTPWTLPSNLALCVGPKIKYVKIFHKKDEQYYILSENRLKAYYPKKKHYDVIESYSGEDLKDKEYKPLFPYFKDHPKAFKVLLGEHVTDVDGTGIVHTAPAFGEDDFLICQKYDIDLVMPVDDDGCFTEEVSDFAGKKVKAADKEVIAYLKQKKLLLKHETIDHNVPFCWRSDTPLIYRAVSTWFVKVEQIKEQIIENNKTINWVPEHLRDGRFGKWLEGARDWAISRNRFWGNPIPLWRNKETGETICVGSIKELEKLTGKKITDIHREHLDDLEIPGKKGGVLKRVFEVLDCWFESGAMPYAQAHYPFENKKKFEDSFPADFIAEGIDQTRGWFYTLSVLGTALFGKIPYKNVVVNGMILAEDGKKMSKRLKNYPDPNYILDSYGADSLRLYLIQSPAVRAEELRFAETGVKDIVRRILLKWWNSYSFFANYAAIDNWKPDRRKKKTSDNILDRWILSRMQSLLLKIEVEMEKYQLFNVVPALLDFIEDLTNTYIRFNRKRFWDEENGEDKKNAYRTLYEVLYTFSKVMAPFTPFMAEMVYQNLKTVDKDSKESVHLEDFPLANKKLITTDLEKSVGLMQEVIIMARNLREQAKVKVKIPLKRLTIVQRNGKLLENLKVLENYLKEELNIREIEYSEEEEKYVQLSAKANGAILGPKLGKKFRAVNQKISELSNKDLVELENGGSLQIEGETITASEVNIHRKPREGHAYLASSVHITAEIDITVDEDQKLEGLSREIVNRIQKLRKEADFKLNDRIVVQYKADQTLEKAISEHKEYISSQVLSDKIEPKKSPKGDIDSVYTIEKEELTLALKVV